MKYPEKSCKLMKLPDRASLYTQRWVPRNMYRFEGYTFHTARCSLRTGDRVVELRPRAFEVLRYLVENAGRLVTKEEFIKAVWPDVVVTDESLTHCVSEARQAIGDDRQTIIRTVP